MLDEIALDDEEREKLAVFRRYVGLAVRHEIVLQLIALGFDLVSAVMVENQESAVCLQSGGRGRGVCVR